MSNSVTDTISAMLQPILADLKLELYDLDFNGGILKVTLDTPAGQAESVSIDQISLVTRLLGRELDHNEDAVPGRFTLEVTSPGLERTLRTPHHFAREAGKEVTVRFTSEFNGRRRLAGLLVSATETTASVRLSDTAETIEFPLAIVDRAKTVFVWESQPKPNSKEARAKRAASDKNTTEDQQEASAP